METLILIDKLNLIMSSKSTNFCSHPIYHLLHHSVNVRLMHSLQNQVFLTVLWAYSILSVVEIKDKTLNVSYLSRKKALNFSSKVDS